MNPSRTHQGYEHSFKNRNLSQSNASRRSGKPVKARVIDFRNNGIEMKSLENVSLVRLKGCTKMGISLGETWVEKEGELFATREEAENYLKKKNLLME